MYSEMKRKRTSILVYVWGCCVWDRERESGSLCWKETKIGRTKTDLDRYCPETLSTHTYTHTHLKICADNHMCITYTEILFLSLCLLTHILCVSSIYMCRSRKWGAHGFQDCTQMHKYTYTKIPIAQRTDQRMPKKNRTKQNLKSNISVYGAYDVSVAHMRRSVDWQSSSVYFFTTTTIKHQEEK